MQHLKYADGQRDFLAKVKEQYPELKFPLDLGSILIPLIVKHGDKDQQLFLEQHAGLIKDIGKRMDVAKALPVIIEMLEGEKEHGE